MNKKLIIWYFLLMGSLCVMAAKRRKVIKLQKTPLHRSLEPEITSTGAEIDVEVPKVQTKAKLFVIKPRSYAEADEGRFLKHILLYKSFLQPQTTQPGHIMPYVIINNPTNLTNINKNTLNNVPQIGITVPTGVTVPTGTIVPTGTTVPTGTGTDVDGGDSAAGGGGRIVYIRDSQALPTALPLPMSQQIYQQRHQQIPQMVYGVPLGNVNQNKRRRNRYANANSNGNKYVYQNSKKRRTNPFSIFANNLRRVQFL